MCRTDVPTGDRWNGYMDGSVRSGGNRRLRRPRPRVDETMMRDYTVFERAMDNLTEAILAKGIRR